MKTFLILLVLSSCCLESVNSEGAHTKNQQQAAAAIRPQKYVVVSGNRLDTLDSATTTRTNNNRQSSSNTSNEAMQSTRKIKDNWNVQCGNGGLCSADYPICCGGATGEEGLMFCISGGQKCCQSLQPSVDINACEKSGICCPNSTTARCCENGLTCISPGVCAPDPCLNYTDPSVCTAQKSGSGACSWCCSSNRCIPAGSSCRGTQLTKPTEQCKDVCSYATSCRQCNNMLRSENDSGCVWCCQTQSCMSSEIATNVCDYYNTALSVEQCADCGPYGHGIYVRGTNISSTFRSVFIAIGCLVVIIGVYLVVRVIQQDRRSRRSEREAEQRLLEQAAPQIRKYGFSSSSDTSVKISKNKCAKCKKSCTDSKKKKGNNEGGAGEVGIVLLPCGHVLCEDCVPPLPEHEEEGRDRQHLHAPSSTVEATALRVRSDTSESMQDRAAVAVNAEEEEEQHRDQGHTATEGQQKEEEAGHHHAAVRPSEVATLKSTIKSCPNCHVKVEDTVVPSSIIR